MGKYRTRLSKLHRSLGREQIMILAAAAFLALVYTLSGKAKSPLNGNLLPRAGFGEAESEYSLLVDGLPEGRQEIRIRVRPREYTEEEAEAQFEGIASEAAEYILGNNVSLAEVRSDLHLPGEFSAYPGIRLTWEPEDPELITFRGEVMNRDLTKPRDSLLHLRMKTGSFKDEVVLPVTVYPPKEGETGNSLPVLTDLIDTADLDQVREGNLELPETVGDIRLSYHMQPDLTGLKILLCGILAAAMLGFRPAQEKKIAAKKRETELLLDYAEVVSRLMVYLGAGMTIRNAWGKITKEYEDAKAAGRTEERAAYEEMIQTALELEKGVSERRAYVDFAHRCGPRCYLRLASILEQNLRTGDKRLAAALELEIQEAFEQRRNAARRLGEEAGTKLVVPLVLSLLAVMMTVTMPALLTMM